MAAGKQAVLEGYEADAVNPPLRFGDGVTFIPNGCNGVAAYAGSVARPLCAVPSAPDTLCCAKRPVACVHAAHARVRTCAPSHLRAHTHARTHARTLACTRTRTRTHAHARARTRTHAHARARTRMPARTRTHAHARAHRHIARVLTRVRGRSDDARAWVEVLDDGIQVPPNLRDCHWRLVLFPHRSCAAIACGGAVLTFRIAQVPRRVYTEAKALRKVKGCVCVCGPGAYLRRRVL